MALTNVIVDSPFKLTWSCFSFLVRACSWPLLRVSRLAFCFNSSSTLFSSLIRATQHFITDQNQKTELAIYVPKRSRASGRGLGPGNREKSRVFWALWNGIEPKGECHLGPKKHEISRAQQVLRLENLLGIRDQWFWRPYVWHKN